ncbi:hypothetical protein PF005_g6512 [Phytophthora fragariae]|uniref:Uncharacterized protein n=1 Tax=Phytophthora fragariae TaxID=53985 RepID=A0A6A3YQM0_9STRA|nr:hypothetical protein PF009_g729 [Phytophthora fragariae]KAE9019972.1 hypothetical protein PF011_g5616 [Phytophthora fragariae]KAE9125197.1 hypothetical protein PF010_g5705 [Phytophthora fragariae]KAE9125334.1 hypothetical protein PF007_g6388 [Phytophthora fragariae]KAE9222879.1 hypothetical protein PF005_g6512 [Phytophthora fragariae]
MSSDAQLDEANARSTAEKTAAPSTPTKRKRFVWSEGMIECLLSLRMLTVDSVGTCHKATEQRSPRLEPFPNIQW